LAHSFCGGLEIHLLDKIGKKDLGYGTTLGAGGGEEDIV